MNKQFYLFMLCTFLGNMLFAQGQQGARLTAMGRNGTAVKDIWGVLANPALITDATAPKFQLTYQQHAFSQIINNQALVLVVPLRSHFMGLGIQRYGITEYQNIQIGIVSVQQFGPNLTIGLRANYHGLKIDNYGSTIGISIDLGTFYQLTDELSFGFYINNPSKENYNTDVIRIRLPTSAYFGIAYRTSDKLLIASTMSDQTIALGIDYQLMNFFSMRSGINLKPFSNHFGVGFNLPKFMVDFTFTKHQNIGYSPQLTIGYVF